MLARFSRATLLYGLFVTDTCTAQIQTSPLRFQHLTVEDGLPENSVRVILQDRLGFLWFGTQRGLVRYDGYTLKPYDVTKSLSENWLCRPEHVREDREQGGKVRGSDLSRRKGPVPGPTLGCGDAAQRWSRLSQPGEAKMRFYYVTRAKRLMQ